MRREVLYRIQSLQFFFKNVLFFLFLGSSSPWRLPHLTLPRTRTQFWSGTSMSIVLCCLYTIQVGFLKVTFLLDHLNFRLWKLFVDLQYCLVIDYKYIFYCLVIPFLIFDREQIKKIYLHLYPLLHMAKFSFTIFASCE